MTWLQDLQQPGLSTEAVGASGCENPGLLLEVSVGGLSIVTDWWEQMVSDVQQDLRDRHVANEQTALRSQKAWEAPAWDAETFSTDSCRNQLPGSYHPEVVANTPEASVQAAPPEAVRIEAGCVDDGLVTFMGGHSHGGRLVASDDPDAGRASTWSHVPRDYVPETKTAGSASAFDRRSSAAAQVLTQSAPLNPSAQLYQLYRASSFVGSLEEFQALLRAKPTKVELTPDQVPRLPDAAMMGANGAEFPALEPPMQEFGMLLQVTSPRVEVGLTPDQVQGVQDAAAMSTYAAEVPALEQDSNALHQGPVLDSPAMDVRPWPAAALRNPAGALSARSRSMGDETCRSLDELWSFRSIASRAQRSRRIRPGHRGGGAAVFSATGGMWYQRGPGKCRNLNGR